MSLKLRCRLGLPSQKCLSLLDPISSPPFPFVSSDVLIRIQCLPMMISCRVRLARFEAASNVCGGCGLKKPTDICDQIKSPSHNRDWLRPRSVLARSFRPFGSGDKALVTSANMQLSAMWTSKIALSIRREMPAARRQRCSSGFYEKKLFYAVVEQMKYQRIN